MNLRLVKEPKTWLAVRRPLTLESGMSAPVPPSLIVNLSAYEGPLEVLLELAKTQKVDLAQISILQLVDQYLAFVRAAKRQNLELAADYLVMAALLAYLKSQLLLPCPAEGEVEAVDPAEIAAALAARLKRLEAMKAAGEQLWALPQLGQRRFATLRQPLPGLRTKVRYTAGLYDLLNAYAGFRRRQAAATLRVKKPRVFGFEEALTRVQSLLQVQVATWTRLQDFLPEELTEAMPGDGGSQLRRSALASTLFAGLELSKQGQLELRQDVPFGPVMLRPLGKRALSR